MRDMVQAIIGHQVGSVFRGFGLAILVLLVVGLSSLLGTCEGNGYEEVVNCKHLECVPYEVIYTQKEFEIRSYKNATWISTSPITSSSYKDAVGKGFNIYIQGNNNKGAKIDMTAPVFVDITPSTGPFCESSFVVHFYVPQKYQKNTPLSKQAHPMKLPKHRYAAVGRFGGFMDDTNIPTQASALKESLKGTKWESSIADKDSGDTSMSSYTVAGYNSPFEYKNRVNEVILWFDKY